MRRVKFRASVIAEVVGGELVGPDVDVEGANIDSRELRSGQTLDGKNKVKTPSGVLSTAEAISLLANSMALSGNFGDGSVSDHDLASGLQGAVIKDDDKDLVVWKDYLGNVMKKRGAAWRGLYSACQAHVGGE